MSGPAGPGRAAVTVDDLRDQKQRWCIVHAGSHSYIGKCGEDSGGTIKITMAVEYMLARQVDPRLGQVQTTMLVLPVEMMPGPMTVVVRPDALVHLSQVPAEALEQFAAKVAQALEHRPAVREAGSRLVVPGRM